MHFSLYDSLGHSLMVKSLPFAPPTRKCESHIAAEIMKCN